MTVARKFFDSKISGRQIKKLDSSTLFLTSLKTGTLGGSRFMDRMDLNDLKLFPADEVVQVTIQTADPFENPNWKRELQADAAYEGAVYSGLVDQTDEDSLTLIVPKSDLRTWEQTASDNGADLSLKMTDLSGSQGLKRFHLD